MRPLIVLLTTLLAICVVGIANAAHVHYTITDLGDLPGGDSYSVAQSLNDNGQVVGYSDTAPNVYDGDDGYHAFIWDAQNGLRDIVVGTSIGSQRRSVATNINQSGTVVGDWHPAPTGWIRGFKWSNTSGAVDLGTAGFGPYSRAQAINDNGFIVQNDWNFYGPPSRVYLRSPSNTLTNIGTGTGVPNPMGYAINNANQIVGGNYTAPGNAYRWDAATGMTVIAPLAGFIAANANCINEAGTVAGNCYGSNGSQHPFIWDPINGIIDLGVLNSGLSYGIAFGINDTKTVVGLSRVDVNVNHAFIWTQNDGLIDLNDYLVNSTGWQYLTIANDINNSGQIVGEGLLTNGNTHAFLLTPAPDPVCVNRPRMDINDDCKVNLIDFAEFASEWLTCGFDLQYACWE